MVICMGSFKLEVPLPTCSLLTPGVWVLNWPVACDFQAFVLQHRCGIFRLSDLKGAVRADTHGTLDMIILLCMRCLGCIRS